ncbi:GNAT family N-acetyltransferase [Saccharopolyspora sp. HNM0983]|uniref:GNAT family N-acetyltransferase n=1 Tax=Saccharopolyspora montiporae TaxID=2781240 RepID=A0A929FX52_9PSEU|nr:GNAT family N-acetyltransferase [Saccharopolyspora sp. HNM0983]MBE9374301.1 GNAT family N-acetyltransferase [Saccharopolyspora sp. HNM0983]
MADADVRTAGPADADEITRIQVSTWRTAYRELLHPDVLDGLDPDTARNAWRQTLVDGPAAVLLATEGGVPVGFCASGPAPEPEAAAADGAIPDDLADTVLVSTLLVEPRWGRRGHGGRLLAAAAQQATLRGAARGITWVPEADAASTAFFRHAGWDPDGTVRTLDAGGIPLRELRLSGSLDLHLTTAAAG